jgi:phytol kinase
VISSDIIGASILLGYYLIVVAIIPTLLKTYTKIPAELVRKGQHIGYSLSIFPLLRLFSTWYMAIFAALLLLLIGYPFLLICERLPLYKKVFVIDRSKQGGELRKQLVYVQLSFAALIAVFWGLLGIRSNYVVAVAVMAWGFGDAAAALVGKTFGRRHVLHRYIERAKTYEGMAAMMVVAGAAAFFTLLIYGGQPWHVSLLVSVVVAPVCGVVELFSRKGTDTLTVPFTAAVVILPLVNILSLLGW